MAFKFIQQLMNVKVVKTVNKKNEGATIQERKKEEMKELSGFTHHLYGRRQHYGVMCTEYIRSIEDTRLF